MITNAIQILSAVVGGLLASGRPEVTIPAGRYCEAKGLVLSGLTNVTVNAVGVELVRTTYGNGLVVTNCSGLTVRGLTIDYEPLPWTQGRVVSVDAAASSAETRASRRPRSRSRSRKMFGSISSIRSSGTPVSSGRTAC